jgi:hypothetical protein
MPPRVCLLTVHGIGFQQPPTGGRDGYADGLHDHLRKVLGDRLGEDCEDPADPERPRGPVYVQSEVEGKRELGLGRLDRELTAGGDIAQSRWSTRLRSRPTTTSARPWRPSHGPPRRSAATPRSSAP